MVVLLTEGSGVYTADVFESLLSKADRRNRYEFWNYRIASSQLFCLVLISWWVSALIREHVLMIELLLSHVRLSCVVDTASHLMTLERLSHDLCGDPWESEEFLRGQTKKLTETILGRKEHLEEIYNDLNEFIKEHLAITGAMVELSKTMDMPEIASIPKNTMAWVETLNESVRKLEDPYREIFPEIDIDSLKPSQADIDEWVTRVSDLIVSITA